MKFFAAMAGCCLALLSSAEIPFGTQGVVSFRYDGEEFRCDRPVAEQELPRGKTWRSRRYEYRTPDGRLGVRLTWKFYDNYDAAEYVPEFFAVGPEKTGIVTKLASFDFVRHDADEAEQDATAIRIRALYGDTSSAEAFSPAARESQTAVPTRLLPA